MKKVIPLVCLPLLCLLWLVGCNESQPTAPEATVAGPQAASVGPAGKPGWVRAYATVNWNPADGWRVLYGYNVDRVIDTGDGHTCLVLDPKLGFNGLDPAAIVVTSGPWQTAGVVVFDDSVYGDACIYVWTGHVDNPGVPAQGYSIVVY
jgi:hypothetical protein